MKNAKKEAKTPVLCRKCNNPVNFRKQGYKMYGNGDCEHIICKDTAPTCSFCLDQCRYQIKSKLGIQHCKDKDVLKQYIGGALAFYPHETVHISFTDYYLKK